MSLFEILFVKMKAVMKLVLMLISIWCMGLIIFYSKIPEETVEFSEPESVDAFIILTGGKNRIEDGVRLFANSKAPLLLISGVANDDAIINVKRTISEQNIKLSGKQIIYGKIADSTLSNALESSLFIRLHNIRECVMITSNYHLPRVKYIFSELIPDTHFTYYPIFSDKFIKSGDATSYPSFLLVIKEYNKLIGSIILIYFNKAEGMWDRSMLSIADTIKQML